MSFTSASSHGRPPSVRPSLLSCGGSSSAPSYFSGSDFVSDPGFLSSGHQYQSCFNPLIANGGSRYARGLRSMLISLFKFIGRWFVPTGVHNILCDLYGGRLVAPLDKSLFCSFTFDMDTDSSFYARLFPGMELNCYRQLIPWVRIYSVDASQLMDGVLPLRGPIVAIDLAYFLSAIVMQFDLKHMVLPTVMETNVMGVRFLHVVDDKFENVRSLVTKLLNFDGYVGGGGVDATHMINVAASVGASTIAANEASTIFRNSLQGMVEVSVALTEEEEGWILRDRKHVNFTQRDTAAHDHAYLAACREIIRKDFDCLINLKTTTQRVLVLGASVREYKEYNNNIHVSFQFANQETKDIERTVMDCLKAVRSIKVKKITRKVKCPVALKKNADDLKSVDDAMKEWQTSRKLPDRIYLWEDTEKMLRKGKDFQFDALIFQDVGYNFSSEDWGNIFRATGALSAIGYMCLPWELIQPDVVPPPGYAYCQRGKMSYLAYHGFSNGYSHLTESWKTLMVNCAMKFKDFNISVEFMSRVGPMTLVRLTKTTAGERIVRHLEMPEYLRSVSILDVPASFDRKRSQVRLNDLIYFSIRKSEFDDCVNYALDIAKDSLNYNNVLLFIRRRCSGITLMTKQLSKTWSLPPAKIPVAALVVYLYVMYLCKDFIKIQDVVKDLTISPFVQYIRRKLSFFTGSVKYFLDFFSKDDMFLLLTKEVSFKFWQECVMRKFSKQAQIMVDTGVGPEGYVDNRFDIIEEEEEQSSSSCYFCHELKEACGEQLFTCEREKEEDFFHNFSLNNAELTHLRTGLEDTIKDPIGLKTIKEDALKHTPMSTFGNDIRVKYLCGPPGTGKSHIIRAMATKQDLVLAPFSRLRDDYTNFNHPITGIKCSLKFHTQHSGFLAMNHSRIFVDEFTAMPYDCLAVIVNNCAADEVILVGDHKQTSLIHGIEGISVETKIKIHDIRAHYLVKNFRNPRDAVNVLNSWFNYRMLAVNTHNGFLFDDVSNYSKYPDHTPLFFRHATAASFGLGNDVIDKVTVRANQGATYDNVKLIITGADKELFMMPSMAIVALSRHRLQCVILAKTDSNTAAFLGLIKTHLKDTEPKLPSNISPLITDEEVTARMSSGSGGLRDLQTRPEAVSSLISDRQAPSSSDPKQKDLSDKKKSAKNIKRATAEDLTKSKDTITKTAETDVSFTRSDVSKIKPTEVVTPEIAVFPKLWADDIPTIDDLEDMDIYDYDPEMPPLEIDLGDGVVEVDPSSFGYALNEYFVSDISSDLSFEELRWLLNEGTNSNQTSILGRIPDPNRMIQPKQTTVATKIDVSNIKKLATKNEIIETTSGTDVESSKISPSSITEKETFIVNPMFESNVPVEQEKVQAIGSSTLRLGESITSDLSLVTDEPKKSVVRYSSVSEFGTDISADTPRSSFSKKLGTSSIIKGFTKAKIEGESRKSMSLPSGQKFLKALGRVKLDIGTSSKSRSKSKVLEKIITPPTDCTCLLELLAQITDNSIKDVWESLLTAIGVKWALEIYNKPLSTRELDEFCHLNNIRVVVIDEQGIGVDCGVGGLVVYSIRHSKVGLGHFSCTDGDPILPITLTSNIEDLTHESLREVQASYWSDKFKIVEKKVKSMSQSRRTAQSGVLNDRINSNLILKRCVEKDLGLNKPFQDLTANEFCSVINKTPIDEELFVAMLTFLYLNKNERFINVVKEKLSKLPPLVDKLTGASEIQVQSLPSLSEVVYKECPPPVVLNDDFGFVEMARLFTDPVYLRGLLVGVQVDQLSYIHKIEQSPFDSFKMLVHDFSTIDENYLTITNQESLNYISDEFDNGVFDMTTFDGLNPRHHPKTSVEYAWCLLNVAPGVTYFKSNLAQSLHCLQARYLTRAFSAVFNNESLEKAREIADLFFTEHMIENFDIFNEQDLCTTVHESEHAMKIKNYDKQTTFDLYGDKDVRFTMKDIFKPIKGKVDVFKAGQGISAWSKDMQTIFQTSFRLINKHFINSLKPHVVYDNGIDEFTLMLRINALFSELPSTAINGVIDATACDSGQNRFTQAIERQILTRLGISDGFLDWYYEMRESYVLKGYGVIARVNDIKTSGEPATLLNNTILMAALMNYIIRGQGPSVLVVKGDDGLKRQANMVYRTDVLKQLKRFMKMQIKVDINVPMTFCGYFLYTSNLVPDIIRKVFKLLGHRFRDYQHFCEYQQSLRDWVLVVNKLGVTFVTEITAESYGLTFEYCYSLFHSIVSLTHIGERQFKKIFNYRAIDSREYFYTTKPWVERVPWYKSEN